MKTNHIKWTRWIIASLILLITLIYTYTQLFNHTTLSYHSEKLNIGGHRAEIDSSFTLKLDEFTTSDALSYYQYDEDDSVLYMLNKRGQSIYSSKYPFKELSLSYNANMLYGTDYSAIASSQIQGFSHINSDSVIIYDYNGAKISLISLNNGLLWQKSLYKLRGEKFDKVFPFVCSSSPMVYDELTNKVYLSGFYGDEGAGESVDYKRKVLVNYNLNTSDIEYSITYPSFYWGYNWAGMSGYRQPFHCYNEKKSSLIINFMADHNLLKYDLSTNDKNIVFAGSSFFDTIRSMTYHPSLFDFISSQKKVDYYKYNSSYEGVVFDPSKDKYYRIAKRYEYGQSRNIRSLIILDDKFSFYDEQILPESLNTFRFFSNSNGVWFLNQDLSDHRSITFSRIKIITRDEA